ncbi:MAG TPA: FAD-dependent oxidoreductase [Microlunatus sp.]
MMDTDVVISGAGIAGAAAAYWMARAGLKVTVVERAPRPRPGGQTVDLRGAGRTVIERMGLLDRARAIATEQNGLELVGKDGRSLFRLPTDAFGGNGIISEIEILRGDLADLLFQATLPSTTYIFDNSITALTDDADGITVQLESGDSLRCRLVIGADGSHSVVRDLVFADQAAARPVGCYTSWFSTPDDLELDGWVQMYNAPGGLVAMVRPGHPGEQKVGLSFRSSPLSYDRRDLSAQRQLLAQRFAGAGWQTPQLLQAMQVADDFFFDSMDQVKLPRWHRDRVVLLGDAGYCPSPLSGLGTSLAIVGAYVLAGELARHDLDHRLAFPRYDEIMRPYIAQAQQLPGGGVAGFAPNSRFMINMRTASMRASTHWPLRALMASQFTKADAIELPHYEFASTGPTVSAEPAS